MTFIAYTKKPLSRSLPHTPSVFPYGSEWLEWFEWF